ncbi:DUF5304 domain-containing protein [Streptomyces sp. TS71-3]|uniref:DUF5304 domain-containing protein n=1 Tax=Streptomyces sp. TS71-3 TaxID=2733862 RepID=UPI001B25B2C9|nr:DUF5304 domain-containing protein [Streptomyces sp. TS71-3]GHJ38181.1 hypothetical protein Sm713_37900 [Streptomyces sp. TS71-3]
MSEAERPDLPEDPREANGPQSPYDTPSRPAPDPDAQFSGLGGSAPDPDAWATAVAEDLAEERARRRARYGPPPGSAAEELRKLLDVVADRLTGLSGAAAPLLGTTAQGAAQQMVRQAVKQARAAVEPVIERNPDVLDHLAAAGSELLSAYRSVVSAQEQRWTRGGDHGPAAKEDHGDHSVHPDPRSHGTGPDRPEEGRGPGEHIDLD